ncbi:MAG: redox-regulated ATPase YchF [Clostridia bacterium]|nr:redox-regulated ATPase YchF [Clostridia bacterium]
MELGVVGLPNVGKSTLFNAITKAGAESANYPFCTIEPNVGIVAVPDERLNVLGKMYNTKKITHASLKFVDIAGLVKGASRGEGLGNRFLASIRECEAIVHVVRCFEDANITHVEGSIDPIRDIETINLELSLADLDGVVNRIEKAEKRIKQGDKEAIFELSVLKKLQEKLDLGQPARLATLSKEEQEFVDSLFLITTKPVIYACNIAEADIAKDENSIDHVVKVKEYAKKENAEVLVISAKVEQELTELEDDERALFLEDLGLKESGLDRIIKIGYRLLGQISFLTAGEKEVRAWTISKGAKAPEAAGKIHSDFEKGFIRAEVVSYETLVECGGYVSAKEKGKVRVEGKEYVVEDGDVMLFRFNV